MGYDIDKAALDRHITGNYGEDQFRNVIYRVSKARQAGEEARRKGLPITACRCRAKHSIQDWKAGWIDMDMELGGVE